MDKWTAATRLTTSPPAQQQQKRSIDMLHKAVNSVCYRQVLERILYLMTTELEKHARYWVGMEHSLFLGSLHEILAQAPERFAQDTERRKAWFLDRAHLFPELMLVGCFLYLEGQLGDGWIAKYGRKHKRDLYCLRLIRNAIVHTAGDLKKLRPFRANQINARKGRPPDINVYVLRYARALRKGEVKDGKNNQIPAYFAISNGVIQLNDDAFRVLHAFSLAILKRAGLFPPPDSTDIT